MPRTFRQVVVAALIGMLASGSAFGQATQVPNAKQQFIGPTGAAYNAGKVFMYVPNTTTFKTTWQDAAQGASNTNPITLDSAGRATIWGVGSYRQLVKDSAGNTIWDAVTTAPLSASTAATSGAGDFLPIGAIYPIAGFSAPVNYVLAYGQALSRITYSDALTAFTISSAASCINGSATVSGITSTAQIKVGAPIEASCLSSGTTVASITGVTSITVTPVATITSSTTIRVFNWGNGNGSTTFNVPDLRGRILPGATGMGGVIVAGTLTSTFYGANPAVPGVGGGSQERTLLPGNLPAYTPVGTIPSYTPTGTVSAPTITINAAGTSLLNIGGAIWQSGANGGAGAITATSSAPVFTGNAATLTFTGTAQGGTSTPFATVQPGFTVNYVIKVLNGTLPTVGVLSLGGMTGDVLCGAGIICIGNIITGTGGSTKLTVPTTFYVSTAGSDTVGTGTILNPWATRSHAYSQLASNYNLNGQTVTIQLVDGVYTDSFQVYGTLLLGQAGPDGLVFQGNCASPRNTLIQPAAGLGYAYGFFYGPSATLRCQEFDQTSQRSIYPSGADMISVGQDSKVIFADNLWYGCNFFGYNAITVAFGAYATFTSDFTNDVGRCQKTTTGTWSNGGNTIVVASATNIVQGMGLGGGFPTGVPNDAYVGSIVGTTVTINCIVTSPCQFSAGGTGVSLIFSGGGQFFLNLGNGATAYFATNGQSDYSIVDTLGNYPFYLDYVYVNGNASANFQALSVINSGQAYGGCAISVRAATLDTGLQGTPYFPCLYGVIPTQTPTLVSGSNSFTVSSTTGITAGNYVNGYVTPTGTWTAGGSTIALSSATGVCLGARIQGEGLLTGAGALVSNLVGTTVTLPACGAGPRCVGGFATYQAKTNQPLVITGCGIPNGTVVTQVSGSTLVTSNPATASGAQRLAFSGSGWTSEQGESGLQVPISGVTAGSYGDATRVAAVAINAQGAITSAANVTVTPAVGSVTGLGTGVATALGVNVGSAGAPVVNGGALGTPSGGVVTNLTGTAAGVTAGNVTTNANLTGPVTSVGNATTLVPTTANTQLGTGLILIGKLIGANMNSTADQAITLTVPTASFWIDGYFITNASTSLTTVAGGIYTATAKGGAPVLAAAQTYSAITATTANTAANSLFTAGTRIWLTGASLPTPNTIYLSFTTPQGGASTADFYVYGRPMY